MDKLRSLKECATDVYDRHPKACIGAAGATTAALVAAYAWRRAANYVPQTGPYSPDTLPADAYDGELSQEGPVVVEGMPFDCPCCDAQHNTHCSSTLIEHTHTRKCACAQPCPSTTTCTTVTCPFPSAAVVGAGPSGSVCGYFLAKGGGKVAVLDKETFPRDNCGPCKSILGASDEAGKHCHVSSRQPGDAQATVHACINSCPACMLGEEEDEASSTKLHTSTTLPSAFAGMPAKPLFAVLCLT
eukprot:1159951-Pelagomonas_calceolata.AAC.8